MRRIVIGVTAMMLLGAACSTVDGDVARRTSTIVRGAPSPRTVNAVLASHSLIPFDACADYLSYLQEHALELVGPYGLEGISNGYPYPSPLVDVMMFAGEDDGAAPPTTIAQATSGGDGFSRTNVQETGVDEPDMVKTDGERIVVLLDGTLRIVTLDGGTPQRRGSVHLGDHGWAQDMLLSGDRVLVMAVGGDWYPYMDEAGFARGMDMPVYQPYTSVVRLIEVDISDADEPDVVRSMDIDGRYLSARMVDDSVRIVLSSSPTGLVFTYPEGGGLRAERVAEAENRRVIEESTVENWLPYYVTKDGIGRVVDEGTAVECDRAHHPDEFSGLNLLSVMTVDLGDGLAVVDTTGVLADGDTVYASENSLYVATQRWTDWQTVAFDDDTGIPYDTVATQIHRFDITNPDRAEYSATGQVSGWLLNQWSFSEHNGHLRVVVTNAPQWQRWGPTESSVIVLREEDGELKQVGSVGGLGKDENVYSVRFIGDVGYVVTFRQIDPLYTIDLSDPEHPEVVGELKIPGYSAYLHPVGDGLLLGVGQDATERGRIKGAAISLFDVSNPARPKRIDQVKLGDGSSDVEYDHRAFTFWDDLAVVPIQNWSDNFNGVVGITVGDTGLDIAGRASHRAGGDGWSAHIMRSLVIGDHLYTVSQTGVMQSTLSTLEPIEWAAF